MPPTLAELESAVRASWAVDTCDPVDVHLWHPGNPARGQCGVTAMVVNDYFGGELMEAEVRHADETRQGFHTWNRLPGVGEVDWTREQFTDGEVVGQPTQFTRTPGPPRRCAEQYQILRTRVLSTLRRTSHDNG